MAELLDDKAVQEALEHLPEWHREGQTIVRDLELPSFTVAIAFVNAVAGTAEAADHHPDILVHGWNKVRLTLSTHSAGGLTAADMGLAAALDRLQGGEDAP
jgi:4a-hydroxytetrahydrobiopterin dehydratase